MANIAVTKDSPTTFVDTATHALTITVDVSGVGFSVYCLLNGRFSYKARHGQSFTFDIAKNDTVSAWATGTGTIIVTTT